MQVIKSTKIVYFDVDDTLVFSVAEHPNLKDKHKVIKLNKREWYVHSAHVEMLKDFSARGHTVIVWSAGGAEWAAEVVKELGISHYITLCLDKPDWYVDDLFAEEFIHGSRRRYLDLEGIEL